MLFIKILFWLSIIIIFYSYIFYGIIIWGYLKIIGVFSRRNPNENIIIFEPEVSLIIATYNEEAVIKKKIENTLQLDYPADKIKIYFITDGSNDNTNNILKEYNQVELLYRPERQGKVAAINRAMKYVITPFVIFCDANTFLNKDSVKELVKHYQDEKVGAVAGEKKVIDIANFENAAGAEGIYWKYESALKKLDSKFYTVVGAAGELFSIRTELFEESQPDILLDDFMISMNICKKGYRVIYEPKAYAVEAPSLNMKDEQKRKIRIGAGAFQSMHLLKDLLNIFKYGKLSFQYISHRVLRWSICPALLPVILVLNIILYFNSIESVYTIILLLQLLFYCMAVTGWLFAEKNIKIKLFYIPYYFLFMNISLYIGYIRYKSNVQTVLWDKAKRSPSSSQLSQ